MSPSSSRSINSLVERQMRNWELARQQKQEPTAPDDQPVHGFVTISRSVGSGGGDAARALARDIGWPVFDSEILRYMSGEDDVRERLYGTMDERDLSFIEDAIRSLTHEGFNRNDYFHRLTATILAVARKEKAVFLGRGADLILPRAIGLRVRVVAPNDHRIVRFAERHQVTPEQAAQDVARIDKERSEFIRNHFSVDVNSVDRYDLGLNLAALSVDDSVQIIKRAMELRGLLN